MELISLTQMLSQASVTAIVVIILAFLLLSSFIWFMSEESDTIWLALVAGLILTGFLIFVSGAAANHGGAKVDDFVLGSYVLSVLFWYLVAGAVVLVARCTAVFISELLEARQYLLEITSKRYPLPRYSLGPRVADSVKDEYKTQAACLAEIREEFRVIFGEEVTYGQLREYEQACVEQLLRSPHDFPFTAENSVQLPYELRTESGTIILNLLPRFTKLELVEFIWPRFWDRVRPVATWITWPWTLVRSIIGDFIPAIIRKVTKKIKTLLNNIVERIINSVVYPK